MTKPGGNAGGKPPGHGKDAKPGERVVEIDAIDVADWEHDQHTQETSVANLAALIRQTQSPPVGGERRPASLPRANTVRPGSSPPGVPEPRTARPGSSPPIANEAAPKKRAQTAPPVPPPHAVPPPTPPAREALKTPPRAFASVRVPTSVPPAVPNTRATPPPFPTPASLAALANAQTSPVAATPASAPPAPPAVTVPSGSPTPPAFAVPSGSPTPPPFAVPNGSPTPPAFAVPSGSPTPPPFAAPASPPTFPSATAPLPVIQTQADTAPALPTRVTPPAFPTQPSPFPLEPVPMATLPLPPPSVTALASPPPPAGIASTERPTLPSMPVPVPDEGYGESGPTTVRSPSSRLPLQPPPSTNPPITIEASAHSELRAPAHTPRTPHHAPSPQPPHLPHHPHAQQAPLARADGRARATSEALLDDPFGPETSGNAPQTIGGGAPGSPKLPKLLVPNTHDTEPDSVTLKPWYAAKGVVMLAGATVAALIAIVVVVAVRSSAPIETPPATATLQSRPAEPTPPTAPAQPSTAPAAAAPAVITDPAPAEPTPMPVPEPPVLPAPASAPAAGDDTTASIDPRATREQVDAASTDDDALVALVDGPGKRKPNRRGTRGKAAVDAAAYQEVAAPAEDEEDVPAKARARATYNDGNQALFAGNSEAAIAAYRQTIAIVPMFAPGFRGLGLAYAQQGNTGAAVMALRTYLRLAPRAKDVALIKQRITALQATPATSP